MILDAGDAQAKGVLERSHRFMRTNFEPGRRFANELDFQAQLDGWTRRPTGASTAPSRAVPAERLAEERERMRPLPARLPDIDRRFVMRVAQQPYLRFDRNDYSLDPRLVGRRVEVRVSQREIIAVGARHRRARCPPPAGLRRRADLHRPRPPAPARPAARRAAPARASPRSSCARWPAMTR